MGWAWSWWCWLLLFKLTRSVVESILISDAGHACALSCPFISLLSSLFIISIFSKNQFGFSFLCCPFRNFVDFCSLFFPSCFGFNFLFLVYFPSHTYAILHFRFYSVQMSIISLAMSSLPFGYLEVHYLAYKYLGIFFRYFSIIDF